MTLYDIVIVHSSAETRLQIERSLRRRPGCRLGLRQADTLEEAVTLLRQRLPDCLILEVEGGPHPSLDFLHKELGSAPCPVVAVLHGISAQGAMQVLKEGAQDYVFAERLSEPVLWQAVEYARSRHELKKKLEQNHRKLARLDDELRRKSSLRSAVLATATHDLRTPITAIMGLVSLLRQRSGDPESQEMLKNIAGCCDALLFSVNDILDLADLQTGKLILTRNVFSPENVVKSVIETARIWATGKGLTLSWETSPNMPQVLGDERRTRQVLFNLVSNAIKFTERGEVTLRAHVHSKLDDEVWILYEVCDTGIGIAPRDRRRIFNRNVQAAGGNGSAAPGAGLGLWVVKQLTLRLGGTLGLRSQIGEGSTFSIRLPYQSTARAGLPRRRQQSCPRILVAEDNNVLARVLAGQLEHLGYEVELAGDGVEAMGCLDKGSFDLAVFDARMPRMDGIAACRQLRKRFSPEDLPVILLTADSLLEERVWRRAGFSQLLVKPVEIGRLQAVIGELLGESTGAMAKQKGISSSLR
jgi:signal transduction histidine kinase